MNKTVKKIAILGGVAAAGYVAKKVYDFVKIRPLLGNLLVGNAEMPANIFSLKDALKGSKRPKALSAKPKPFSLKQAALLGEGIFTEKDGTFN
ncbi:MAG: hypothetical protein WCT52_01650 [Candidatus Micrarchaeia archaeon]